MMFFSTGLGLRFGLEARGLGASSGALLLWAWVLHLARFFFGLGNGPTSPFFKLHQLPPSPCARCTLARAITFLVSGVISMSQLGVGSVRALSPSYVL